MNIFVQNLSYSPFLCKILQLMNFVKEIVIQKENPIRMWAGFDKTLQFEYEPSLWQVTNKPGIPEFSRITSLN